MPDLPPPKVTSSLGVCCCFLLSLPFIKPLPQERRGFSNCRLYSLAMLDLVFFFLFFFFGSTCSIWKFPGQGSNLSCRCGLRHSCSNTGSLTHCARPRVKSTSQRQHWIPNLLHQSRNSYDSIFLSHFFLAALNYIIICFRCTI